MIFSRILKMLKFHECWHKPASQELLLQTLASNYMLAHLLGHLCQLQLMQAPDQKDKPQ
nr:MAG TPA: hypothetical protein [Caudoviricetes sp.]